MGLLDFLASSGMKKRQLRHIRTPMGFIKLPAGHAKVEFELTYLANIEGCFFTPQDAGGIQYTLFRLCKLVTTQINQIFINSLVNRNSSIMVPKVSWMSKSGNEAKKSICQQLL